MRNLEPDITRQRLLLEGHYLIDVDEDVVSQFLLGISGHLGLRAYGAPIINQPAGVGRAENQGFDAFVPLIDSGISLYVWTSHRFLAVVLFTCKSFDVDRALDFTRTFFESADMQYESF